MTDVPEYLLRRSKERREALGLAPTGGGAATTGGDAPAPDAPSSAPAGEPAGTPQAPAVPAAATPASTEAALPGPVAVAQKAPRSGIPYWMMPVIAILPLWVLLYMGSFGPRGETSESPAQMGARVYQTKCAGCHGATGGGGAGPPLSGGETKKTFPAEADHIAWVENGSGPQKGQPYGDPAAGKVATTGAMPGFKGQLTDAEIQAVVVYERDGL